MVFWEAALQLIANNFNDPIKYNFIEERATCTVHLSEVYFSKAVAAGKVGGDYKTWIDKLQGLASFSKSLQGEREFVFEYGTGYPSQLYGIWLREYEHAEESVWKDCFRSSVLEGIELLSDDDPSNDHVGYAALARTLLHAGDIDGALSALSVTTKALEIDAGSSSSDDDDSAEEEADGPAEGEADGSESDGRY